MSDEDGAWASEELFVESGSDWFDKVVEVEVEWLRVLCDDADEDVDVVDEFEETSSGVNVDVVEELGEVSGEAFVMAELIQTAGVAELYDSGCTNHILPY